MKFRVLSTEIYVSFLFAATVSFMLATDRTGLMIPTLFAVLIHEAGHLTAMWAADCAPKEIRLIPGSVQIVEYGLSPPRAQAAVLLCGPLANVAVSAALFINFYLGGYTLSLRFCMLNATLALFNMLPVSGLDGGRLLLLLLQNRIGPYTAARAVRIATAVLAAAALAGGIALTVYGRLNVSVFIVALYLAICALIKT